MDQKTQNGLRARTIPRDRQTCIFCDLNLLQISGLTKARVREGADAQVKYGLISQFPPGPMHTYFPIEFRWQFVHYQIIKCLLKKEKFLIFQNRLLFQTKNRQELLYKVPIVSELT